MADFEPDEALVEVAARALRDVLTLLNRIRAQEARLELVDVEYEALLDRLIAAETEVERLRRVSTSNAASYLRREEEFAAENAELRATVEAVRTVEAFASETAKISGAPIVDKVARRLREALDGEAL